jgi:hypothetical protein
MLLASRRVLVIGFGSIGEGLARLAQTLGARVTIYDVFATKRLFAKHHGYEVVEKEEFDHILSKQDVIFMATNAYQGTTLGIERLLLMRDGAIICNAGSGRGELSTELQRPGKYRVHDASMVIEERNNHLEIIFKKYDLTKKITVLAKSFPINLHIGAGTSHDAIEVVMTLMLLAAISGPASKKAGIQPLANDIEEYVAEFMLRTGTPPKEFKPTYVKTRGLSLIDKPYGGVSPFHNELSGVAGISVARAWFRAKSKTRGHYHLRSQEAYYAEKGTADIFIWPAGHPEEIEVFKMAPSDYLLVPENYFHDVQVTSDEDFECLVIATPPFAVWDQFFKEGVVDEAHTLTVSATSRSRGGRGRATAGRRTLRSR